MARRYNSIVLLLYFCFLQHAVYFLQGSQKAWLGFKYTILGFVEDC